MLVLLPCLCLAQTERKEDMSGVKTVVCYDSVMGGDLTKGRRIIEKHYDRKGQLIANDVDWQRDFDPFKHGVRFTYDKRRLVRQETSGELGYFYDVDSFYYDRSGRVVSRVSMRTGTTNRALKAYEYSHNGDTLRIYKWDYNGVRYLSEQNVYNASGQLLEEIQYTESKNRKIYTYDDKKRVIKKVTTHGITNERTVVTHEYSATEDIETTDYGSSKIRTTRTVYEGKDKKGRWLSYTRYEDGEFYEHSRRVFTYY